MRLLYLDCDTLRADHLGCYGYHRDTSPTIDAIAKEGVVFTNYHCSDAPCLPSRAALMSGRFGIHTGIVNHGGLNADMRPEGASRGFRDRMAFESLPAVLRRAGFKTATVSPFAERHGAWWFYAAFTEMYNPGKGGMESAEEVTPLALDWIRRHGAEENWFLHVNYWDPHTPYRAPEEFGNPFKDAPLPAWLTPEVLEAHRAGVGPHGAREINMYDASTNPRYPRHPGELRDMEDVRRMIDGYDCGVRYMDTHIGQLLEALDAEGALDDLVVIISADHGENLGEQGLWGEHATADEPTSRIPFIVCWPGGKQGHVDSGFHYNLDLLPTLAELLDVHVQNSWDGESFAPALTDGAECGREYLVVSQCAHGAQRSVRFDNWLYTRVYHDFYHLFPDELLFDLTADPHEQHNLADERPDVCGIAARRLEDWHTEQMKRSPSDVDPLWTVLKEGGPFHARGRLKRYCEYLEETGRGWACEELKRRHPYEFE